MGAMSTGESATRSAGRGRPGRWRTGMESRRQILASARALFARDGYDRVTVRAIAADAGVDPSMIHYFFGRKDRLFAAALDGPESPREPVAALLDEGLDDLGPRLVRRFLEVWDATDAPEPLLTLTRSAATGEAPADMLREFIDREFTRPIIERLGGPEAELRAAMVSGQLLGLAMTRYAVRLHPVPETDPEELARWLGPVVQALLTGPAPR